MLSGGWLGKKQEFCKAILRDAVSFCLQNVLFLRILFANFLLCLLFFVFSVLLLDDILFFFDGPFKKSLIQFILTKPLGGNHIRFWSFTWIHAKMRMKYSLYRMFLRLVARPLIDVLWRNEFSYV